MDPNYSYKISRSLTRLIIKLAVDRRINLRFLAVDDISLYYIVSLTHLIELTTFVVIKSVDYTKYIIYLFITKIVITY